MSEATSARPAEERFEIMPTDAPFEPGFNVKTLWAALFVGFVMLPGAIYLGLVTGMSMAGGATAAVIASRVSPFSGVSSA